MWPFDDGSFDVAVIPDLLPTLTPTSASRCVSEVLRVLRPGGRAIVIEPRAARRHRRAAAADSAGDAELPGPLEALHDDGFAAVRELAETDGVLYVEGIKKAG